MITLLLIIFVLGIILGDPKYFIGCLCTIATISLIEDIIGIEAYINLIKTFWISPWITIPIAIIILLYCIFYIFINK